MSLGSPPPGPAISRDVLVGRIAAFLEGHDSRTVDDVRRAVGNEIDAAGPRALSSLGARLSGTTAGWEYYPRDPLARRIHHVIAELLLPERSGLEGAEHAADVDGRPVVLFANHLSYSDANLLEIVLQRYGAAPLADRLTAMAGPKVYSSRTRRFSSLCYGTIKIPQSSTRASEDAVMSVRDVARAARRAIEIARTHIAAGDALLLFPEGARSRTGGLQEMLPAVARYLEVPGTTILPVGITGTEAMFPVGEEKLHVVPVRARIGPPIEARVLHERCAGDRRLIMEAIGVAIARVLPEPYGGVYSRITPSLEKAARALDAVRH